MYMDRAPQLEGAAIALGIPSDHSRAGRPQNNAIIERFNQDIAHGTKVLLMQAGLPPAAWHLAAEYYCFADNTLPKGWHESFVPQVCRTF